MGDHFVLLVDRLITASTLQAAIESQNMNRIPVAEEKPSVGSTHNWNLVGEGESGSTVPNLVECRICQDEDHDCNMESPCACCGSLKYAHRKCIQRWCNEKGNTVCEICHQQFKPGYTAPPQMFHYGGIPMNFRGSWEISRQDLRNSQFLAMVATDRNFLDSEYDELAASTTRNAFYCRVVAVLFTVLLLLRHVLPILIGEADEYDITILTLSVLKSAAILVPVYVMIQTLTSVHCRRRQQVIQDLPRSVSPITDRERLNVIRVT